MVDGLTPLSGGFETPFQKFFTFGIDFVGNPNKEHQNEKLKLNL
jgi:hypothetical protein